MSTQVLDNATLWLGDGAAMHGHVIIEDEQIAELGAGRYRGPATVVDLQGMALSPGMIDLMVLGGFGQSILSDDPIALARSYLKLGVTGCQLCIGTVDWPGMARIAQNTARAQAYRGADAARVWGLYLEGPFQQPDLTGASLKDLALPPTPEHVQRILQELGDAVTMINVSPNADTAAPAVTMLKSAGKIVSMAHSNAPVEQVQACVDAGTSVLGHVFDNNSGRIGDSGVQQPTVEHVAFTDDRVRFIHLICDGVHVHPVMIRLLLRCRGVETLCLVTDGHQRMGCPDGTFQWHDGRTFSKKGGVCRTGDGWLAGSATTLPDMLRNLVNFTGLPAAQAIRTVTLNPARCLGVSDRVGKLARGLAADLVAWDDQLSVRRVWRAGQEVPAVESRGEVALASASRKA